MAYVYIHRRLDNNSVFYVGISSKDDNFKRASYTHNRTNYWKNIAKLTGWSVEIISNNIKWEEACKLECKLIKQYGRIDLGKGTLVNLTDGGEGSPKKVVTEATRKKMSESRKGKIFLTQEIKDKIGARSKGRNCKKVLNTETGEIYISATEAAKKNNISRDNLAGYLTGKAKNKTGLIYLNEAVK